MTEPTDQSLTEFTAEAIEEYVRHYGDIVVQDEYGKKFGVVIDAMAFPEDHRVIVHFRDDPKSVGSEPPS